MSKQAFSTAQEDGQDSHELVPAGELPDEVPAHAKARPIPRISIQAFCEDAGRPGSFKPRPPTAGSPSPTSACTWVAPPRPWPTTTRARRPI